MAAPSTYAERFTTVLNLKFPGYTYAIMPGRRFDKVTVVHNQHGGRSVHAFIERETGDVLKPAGWNAPARDARGNVATFEGLKDIATRADKFGGYLYKR